MRKPTSKRVLWTAAVLVFCCAPGARAANYTFTLTGVTGSYLGGVYTSPYIANISGVGTGIKVICDDFATDSYIGQQFDASVTSVASLNGGTGVKFDQGNATKQQQDYATAAFLAEEILAQNQSTPQGQYQAELLSFALWAVFDPAALNSLSLGDMLGATADLIFAELNAGSYTQYADVDIWTPTPNQSISQEFLTVGVDPPRMAEPPSPAILCLDLLAFAGLFLVRRSLASRVN